MKNDKKRIGVNEFEAECLCLFESNIILSGKNFLLNKLSFSRIPHAVLQIGQVLQRSVLFFFVSSAANTIS
jgi:hypothetical protein